MANYKRKRKRTTRNVRKKKTPWHARLLLWGAILVVLAIIFWPSGKKYTIAADAMGSEAAIINYGEEITGLSKKYDLDKNYLMALIMLESSGRRDIPPRFEKGVYNKLKEVKEGKKTLEGIRKEELMDASDEALRNLASSWGPFQLMGYKCFHLNIQIKDLRGPNTLEHGVKWINLTYGDYIRKGKYEDAFHIHNTGRPVPKNGKYQTYNSTYVPRGMEYMKYFKEHMQ